MQVVIIISSDDLASHKLLTRILVQVSFACVYLSDEKLTSMINEFWTEYRNLGDIR